MNPSITISAGALKTASAVLGKIIPHRVTLPILRCLHVEHAEIRVRLTATDLNQALTYEHQLEPDPLTPLARKLAEMRWKRAGTVALLIPRDTLRTALKAVHDPLAMITLEPGAITYPLAGSLVRLPFLLEKENDLPSQFPRAPAVQSTVAYRFPAAERAAFIAALPFSSKEETRYVLQGVCLDGSAPDGLTQAVATDGRRLYAAPLPGLGRGFPDAIIPTAAVKLLAHPSLLAADWSFSTDQRRALFHAGPWTLNTDLITGNYPNWRQVIPSAPFSEAPVDEAALRHLQEVLKGLPAPTARENSIKLHFNGGLEVQDTHGITARVPGIVATKEVTLAVDQRFLDELLAVGPGTFGLIDARSPLTYRTRLSMQVLMPMRIS